MKLVKGSGTLRTRGEAEAIAKVAKDSGMTGVKIIEKGPKHFSVYADPEKSLKNEGEPEGDQYDGKYDDQFGPAIANEAEDSFIQAQRDASSEFERQDHDRMMGLIDQNLFPQLPKLKKAVDLARARGLKDRAIFTMLSSNSLVGKSVADLIDDGFDPQDIVDFFGTDFNMEEEVSVSSSGVEMEAVDNPAEDEGKYQYPMAEFGEAVYKASQAGITKETLHKLVDWNAE